MILGTAGHVDHGKTALVRALTGVDTDRLPDEKRRGITIDIGFAPLRLDGLPPVGVVDVPGHEAFVRNMLAGATGIDLAMLVIAADEGVMPQTREHLLILTLLGVSAGVVALSKADLVEEEWLALVREDIADLVRGTPLAGAPVIATSAATGQGLDDLRAAIAALVQERPQRDLADLFRMPVDRSFTVRGTGTVVTGTVWSGSLERDAVGRLLPGERSARVRGLQSHGAAIERAEPGTRVAVALAGVEVGDVHRGAVLVSDSAWRGTTRLLADAALDPAADVTLGPRTRVRLHLGTADVAARLIAPGGRFSSGDRAVARVVLDEPVVARAGDRFVLRAMSPVRTIGGGIVLDPLPEHRRQRATALPAAPAERLAALAERAGLGGIALAEIPVRLGVPPAAVPAIVRDAGRAVETVASRVYASTVVAAARATARRLVDEHHAAHPLEPGIPAQELRERLGADAALIESILRQAERAGELTQSGAHVARSGWTPTLSGPSAELAEQLLQRLTRAGKEPPSVAELAGDSRAHVFSILKFLERQGRVVQVEADRFYEAGALDALVAALREGMKSGGEFAPQEIREILGLSRKYLIPFLEYCDRAGVTERRANGRVLTGALRAEGRPMLA